LEFGISKSAVFECSSFFCESNRGGDGRDRRRVGRYAGDKEKSWEDLSEGEAAAGGGDGAAELFAGFEPLLNDDFYVGESFFVGLSVGGAAGEFGDFGDKRFVGLTLIEDDFVFRHRVLPPSGS
jgi:hypothetical protein